MNPKTLLRLALVLSGLALGGCGTVTPDIIQNPDPARMPPAPEITSFRMMDRNDGWAQTAGVVFRSNIWMAHDTAILRTTNGGQSWKYVLAEDPADGMESCFYDSKRAWVVTFSDETNKVAILRTRDGGRSWVQTRLPYPFTMEVSLTFPDPNTGWLMLIPQHGMNSSPGDLYRTDDGGANWRRVNGTEGNPYEGDNYTQAQFQSRNPWLFYAGPVAFQNASTGWLWGNVVSTIPFFLSFTGDGGLTWQVRNNLPLPPSLHDGSVEPVGLPRFFPSGGKEGILGAQFEPADGSSTNSCLVIYTTRDGGVNWQPTTPVKSDAFPCAFDFISAQTGWIWCPDLRKWDSTDPTKGTLYRTDDGGTTWNSVKPERSMEQYLTHGENIVQLQFVDDECGWALARYSDDRTELLHTRDGGQTWYLLERKIQP